MKMHDGDGRLPIDGGGGRHQHHHQHHHHCQQAKGLDDVVAQHIHDSSRAPDQQNQLPAQLPSPTAPPTAPPPSSPATLGELRVRTNSESDDRFFALSFVFIIFVRLMEDLQERWLEEETVGVALQRPATASPSPSLAERRERDFFRFAQAMVAILAVALSSRPSCANRPSFWKRRRELCYTCAFVGLWICHAYIFSGASSVLSRDPGQSALQCTIALFVHSRNLHGRFAVDALLYALAGGGVALLQHLRGK